MFARIENGIVHEILDLPELPEFHPSLTWVSCPAGTREGDIYDEGTFFSPADLITLEEAKTKLKTDVSALRDAKYREGFTYEGQVFQIGTDAQKDMLSMQMQFVLGNNAAYDGYWMDADNAPKTMTEAEVTAFFQAAFAYVKALKGAAWAHKDAIDDLTDKQALAAYDIHSGWPANS